VSSSFWLKNELLKWNTHPIPLFWPQITCGCFQNKSALKGRRFQDTEDMQKHVMTAQKTLPQQEFQNVSNSGSIFGLSA
jgi:hypothetical protein